VNTEKLKMDAVNKQFLSAQLFIDG